MAKCKASFQIFGPSGSGKTPLLGEFAEHICRESGGRFDRKTGKIVGGERTILFTNDGGGWHSIQPLVDLGIVLPVDLTTMKRPWEWLNAITRGNYPDPNNPNKWLPYQAVLGDDVKIGGLDYEGLTAFGSALMQDMANAAAEGINVGGEKTFSFTQGDTKVGTNNRVHYNLAQGEIARRVTQSQTNGGVYIIWTALTRMAGDDDSLGQVVGPQVVGKALTAEVPRWFGYSFRLVTVAPSQDDPSGKVIHRLYLDDHKDSAAGDATITVNNRLPLDSDALPLYIEPASLVNAWQRIQAAGADATKKIASRFPIA